MPVFFPVVPSGLAAILRRLDFPARNHQLAELSFLLSSGVLDDFALSNLAISSKQFCFLIVGSKIPILSFIKGII